MRNKSPESEIPRTKWRGQDRTESEAGKRYGRNTKKTSFFFPANMAHYVSGAGGETSSRSCFLHEIGRGEVLVGEQEFFLIPEEGSLPWG